MQETGCTGCAGSALTCQSSLCSPPQVALSWRPSLSGYQEVLCVAMAALIACIAYYFSTPAALSAAYATGMGLLFGGALMALRSALLEDQYKVCVWGGGSQDGVVSGVLLGHAAARGVAVRRSPSFAPRVRLARPLTHTHPVQRAGARTSGL